MAEPESENKQLRKELAQMRMERDIVKKRPKGEQTVSRSCGMRADRRILRENPPTRYNHDKRSGKGDP